MDEEYVEQVLGLVERIPRGRVTTYGLLADVVHRSLGRGGPRQVGAVMATYGGPVPWWRVVRADGSLPDSHGAEARQAYLDEGTPLRTSGAVDLRAAVWLPPESSPQVERPIGGQPGGEPPFPVDGGGWPVDDTPGIENCHK